MNANVFENQKGALLYIKRDSFCMVKGCPFGRQNPCYFSDGRGRSCPLAGCGWEERTPTCPTRLLIVGVLFLSAIVSESGAAADQATSLLCF